MDENNKNISYSSMFDENSENYEMLKSFEKDSLPLADEEIERIAKSLWGNGAIEDNQKVR